MSGFTPTTPGGHRYIRVATQKTFLPLDEHDFGSRPDLVLTIHHTNENLVLDGMIEIVMIESKIGS